MQIHPYLYNMQTQRRKYKNIVYSYYSFIDIYSESLYFYSLL